MDRICALTTIDNPYNPFTNFREWLMFDNENDYNCNELTARNANISDSLSDEENNSIIEEAIDDIVKNDLTQMFLKIVK